MSKKKGHGSPVVLNAIRYGIGFIERFFTNLFINLRWVFTNGKTAHDGVSQFYFNQVGEHLHPLIKIAIVAIVLYFCWDIVLGIFLMWTVLKSI